MSDFATRITTLVDASAPPLDIEGLVRQLESGTESLGMPPVLPQRRAPGWAVAVGTAVAVLILIGGVVWLVGGTGIDVVGEPTVPSMPVPTTVALWLDDGPPPLDRDFNTPEQPILAVYGSEQGIPDECAWRIAFAPSGTPLVGGPCGVLQLTDDQWMLIADEEAVGLTLMDLALDDDGGIWIGSPDQPLRRLVGDSVVEMEIGSPHVAIGHDGTIWAVDFPYTGNAAAWPPTLVSYSVGSWRHIGGATVDNGASEGVSEIAVGSDGTVWILIGNELARVSDGRLEVAEIDGPDNGSPMYLAAAPDGAIWIVVQSDEVVDRLGISDVLAYIVRYDGTSSSSLEVPFAEINDLAVHPDGTIWASSVHGVFSYNGEEWTRYGMAEGMPINATDFVEIGPDGSIYAGTTRGLVHIHTGR